MLTLLTAPIAEPVTLAEARLAARVDDDRFDALLPGFIAAARQMAEQACDTRFVRQTWRATLADWPAADQVLPVSPASAVAVSYWSTAGSWNTLDPAAYVWAPTPAGVVLASALSTTWPALGELPVGPRVRVDITAGAAPDALATVPECVKLYIKAHCATWLRTPEAHTSGALSPVPYLNCLLDPAKVYG